MSGTKPCEFTSVIIPNNQVDLQIFIDSLWNDIMESAIEKPAQIKLYNAAAKKYNTAAGFQAITTIDNLKNLKEMTTKKAATKIAASKKSTSEKPATKKGGSKKPGISIEKKVSQKTQIVELAEQGKTVNEIVDLTGLKKSNVHWYFSKLQLSKKNTLEIL